MKFNIIEDYDSVSICMDCDTSSNSFIDIYTGDEPEIPSPFRTVDDAELFAKIIVKLLEVAYDFKR